jgi:hypothetical protein
MLFLLVRVFGANVCAHFRKGAAARAEAVTAAAPRTTALNYDVVLAARASVDGGEGAGKLADAVL